MYQDIKRNKLKTGFIISIYIVVITLIIYFIFCSFLQEHYVWEDDEMSPVPDRVPSCVLLGIAFSGFSGIPGAAEKDMRQEQARPSAAVKYRWITIQ